MYTNRWNLYKAKRLKAEPLCPFSQLGIYFTTSIEPAVSGWWRAKARPNFGAQLPQDSSNPCWSLPLLLTRPLLPLIDQIGSCHRLDLKSHLFFFVLLWIWGRHQKTLFYLVSLTKLLAKVRRKEDPLKSGISNSKSKWVNRLPLVVYFWSSSALVVP